MSLDEELDRFKENNYQHSETLEKSLDPDKMVALSVWVPREMLKQLNNIVERTGLFTNRAEAMRSAFRDFIMKYSMEPKENGRPRIKRL